MAGNQGIYNAAIKKARGHAQEQAWAKALREYQRAAAEFPEDMDARLGIGAAYTGLQRWREALELYRELYQVAPQEPAILERLAETYAQLKDWGQARDTFLRLSDQYVLRRQIAQAIASLERLSQIRPNDDEVLSRLARLYQDAGDRDATARIQIARIELLFRQERFNEAMTLCEQTLRALPNNRHVKELLFRLRREMADRKERGEEVDAIKPGAAVSAYQLEEWVREATERQEQDDLESALRLYERAVQAGLRRGDVSYSLGLLYWEFERLEEAVEQFRSATSDDDYALSSHYALGEVYSDLDRLDEAAQEFERALHLVDLQSIGREAADDLIRMYEAAATVHEKREDLARAASLYTTLAGFLQSKRWQKERTEEFRERAKELTEKSMFSKLRQLGTGILPAIEERARGEPAREPPTDVSHPGSEIPSLSAGTLRPITDFLRTGGGLTQPLDSSVTGAAVQLKPLEEALSIIPPVRVQLPVRKLDQAGLEEAVRELVDASRIYLEKGLFNAAIDACCEVIDQTPDYLPIHLRLAEVYERQDRPEMALSKYQALIDTYQARGDKEKAVEVYDALLALSPDTIATRSRLVDLLIGLGRKKEAAHHMIQVAQLYFRLGQTNQAVATFREVRTLAPEEREVYLEYGLFLLKTDRPEAALGELRHALQMDPQDPVALSRVNIALIRLGEDQPFWDVLATVLKRAEDIEASVTIENEYKEAALHQESPLLYYALGLIQRQGGQIHEAIESFQRAYQDFGKEATDPLQLRLCRVLAEGYLLLDQSEDAIGILQQGLEWAETLAPREAEPAPHDFVAVPTLLSLYHWLAEAHTKAGRPEQSIAALSQAKAAYPFDRATSSKLADLYFRQGDLPQALSELNGLAQHYEQSNQLDLALDILRQMTRLAPNNLTVHERLGHLYIRRGYIDQGLEELEILADLQQKKGLIEEALRSLQQMAEIYWTLGRHDRSYQVYDRIAQLAPDDVAARQQLVNLHILAGRLADALEEQRSIAKIALRQRQSETIVAALHQVLALNPEDCWALRELADFLSSIGEHGQAVRLYRRLVRLEPENEEVTKALQEEERRVQARADAAG
jgi:tetratricopeptide (TPR) repeat protein